MEGIYLANIYDEASIKMFRKRMNADGSIRHEKSLPKKSSM